MITALTRQEQADLRTCESVISKGINTFREVGRALAQIRDAKLYKAEYKTFESYCTTRWGFGRSYANRLIEASGVPEVVPNGTKIETEGAARKYLDEQKQAERPYRWTELDNDTQRKVKSGQISVGQANAIFDAGGERSRVSSANAKPTEQAAASVASTPQPSRAKPEAKTEPAPEPSACDRYQQRLIEWTRKQFDNIDGLTWGHAMSVWGSLAELSGAELDAM